MSPYTKPAYFSYMIILHPESVYLDFQHDFNKSDWMFSHVVVKSVHEMSERGNEANSTKP